MGNSNNRIMRELNALAASRYKTCFVCKEEKSISEFVYTPSSKDNKSPVCRDCEAKELKTCGTTTRKIIDSLCSGSVLNQSDYHDNLEFVELYKINKLIKNKL